MIADEDGNTWSICIPALESLFLQKCDEDMVKADLMEISGSEKEAEKIRESAAALKDEVINCSFAGIENYISWLTNEWKSGELDKLRNETYKI